MRVEEECGRGSERRNFFGCHRNDEGMMEWKTVSEGNLLWGTEVTRVTVENE